MSIGSRRKKPQKTSSSSIIDRTYDSFCQSYGYRFDVKVKKEEYKMLFSMLAEGNIEKETAKLLLSHEALPVSSRLSEIFPLSEVPRKSYRLSGIIQGYNLINKTLIPVPSTTKRDTVYLLCVEQEEVYVVERQSDFLMILHAENDLPFDMRRWNRQMTSLYFRAMYADNRVVRIKDPFRSREIFKQDVTSPEVLVQIRRINPNPSKKQKVKLEGEYLEHSRQQNSLAKTMAAGTLGSFSNQDEDFDFQKMVDSIVTGAEVKKGGEFYSMKTKKFSGLANAVYDGGALPEPGIAYNASLSSASYEAVTSAPEEVVSYIAETVSAPVDTFEEDFDGDDLDHLDDDELDEI